MAGIFSCNCLFEMDADKQNKLGYKNYCTLLQVASLRTNLQILKSPKMLKAIPSDFNLGIDYTGIHNIWTFSFQTDTPENFNTAVPLGNLLYDANLVPMILTDNITAKFDTNCLLVSGSATNVSFLEHII